MSMRKWEEGGPLCSLRAAIIVLCTVYAGMQRPTREANAPTKIRSASHPSLAVAAPHPAFVVRPRPGHRTISLLSISLPLPLSLLLIPLHRRLSLFLDHHPTLQLSETGEISSHSARAPMDRQRGVEKCTAARTSPHRNDAAVSPRAIQKSTHLY